MKNINETVQFHFEIPEKDSTREILTDVYQALKEKGYNPINQIVGYIMSGDPSYITSHQGARSKIQKLQRDDILEELVTDYLKKD